MRTRDRFGALVLCTLMLGAFTLGCEEAAEEPQAMMLEDEQPPDDPDDVALRGDGEMPLPTETSNLRADPDDPRRAAMLEDLDEKAETPGEDAQMPLPEEPPADAKKGGYPG